MLRSFDNRSGCVAGVHAPQKELHFGVILRLSDFSALPGKLESIGLDPAQSSLMSTTIPVVRRSLRGTITFASRSGLVF